jgi:hypothetical protein
MFYSGFPPDAKIKQLAAFGKNRFRNVYCQPGKKFNFSIDLFLLLIFSAVIGRVRGTKGKNNEKARNSDV